MSNPGIRDSAIDRCISIVTEGMKQHKPLAEIISDLEDFRGWMRNGSTSLAQEPNPEYWQDIALAAKEKLSAIRLILSEGDR